MPRAATNYQLTVAETADHVRILTQGENSMKINKNSLVLAAAFTGMLGGTMARLSAAPVNGSSPSAVLQAADNADKKDIEKHACKGLNSCKGNGGGSKKEFGKNSCKGKGACATDGSKPPSK